MPIRLFHVTSMTAILLGGIIHRAPAKPPPAPQGFRWVANPAYSDEFHGTALDRNKWHDHHPYWQGRPPARFLPENVSVEGGFLRLTNGMLDEPDGTFTLGGAAVVSRQSEAFFGYYECRMKASGISMSSTFWLNNRGRRIPGTGYVRQELDIVETVGGAKKNRQFRHRMHSNTHVWHNGKSTAIGSTAPLSPPADEAFHVYGCWWENATTVHFYLNNEHVGTVHPSTHLSETPFDQPMHLNMVTETYDWEIPPTSEEVKNASRNTTLYDWVRAYTLEPDDPSQTGQNP
jgi:beta-glucanase (GH16 family)